VAGDPFISSPKRVYGDTPNLFFRSRFEFLSGARTGFQVRFFFCHLTRFLTPPLLWCSVTPLEVLCPVELQFGPPTPLFPIYSLRLNFFFELPLPVSLLLHRLPLPESPFPRDIVKFLFFLPCGCSAAIFGLNPTVFLAFRVTYFASGLGCLPLTSDGCNHVPELLVCRLAV